MDTRVFLLSVSCFIGKIVSEVTFPAGPWLVDYSDVPPGKTYALDCAKSCNVYATTTATQAYALNVVFRKATADATDLSRLTVSSAESGLFRPENLTGAYTIVNNNPVGGAVQPFFIYVVPAADDKFPVYEASKLKNLSIPIGTEQFDIISSTPSFNLFNFVLGSPDTTVYVFASGSDQQSIFYEKGDRLAKSMISITAPIVTVQLSEKDAFQVQVDQNDRRNTSITPGGILIAMSPGYSGRSTLFASLWQTTTLTYQYTTSEDCNFDIVPKIVNGDSNSVLNLIDDSGEKTGVSNDNPEIAQFSGKSVSIEWSTDVASTAQFVVKIDTSKGSLPLVTLSSFIILLRSVL